MNTMLEAKIVAAKTHAPHAASILAETPARIAASSQGGLAIAITHLVLPVKSEMHGAALSSRSGKLPSFLRNSPEWKLGILSLS
jgi:hypothetical protein